MAIIPLSQAIRDILDDCKSSDAPHDCLQGHIDRLTNDPDWSLAELLEVRTKAKRILTHVLNGPPTG